jgi:hypothetical protein
VLKLTDLLANHRQKPAPATTPEAVLNTEETTVPETEAPPQHPNDAGGHLESAGSVASLSDILMRLAKTSPPKPEEPVTENTLPEIEHVLSSPGDHASRETSVGSPADEGHSDRIEESFIFANGDEVAPDSLHALFSQLRPASNASKRESFLSEIFSLEGTRPKRTRR